MYLCEYCKSWNYDPYTHCACCGAPLPLDKRYNPETMIERKHCDRIAEWNAGAWIAKIDAGVNLVIGDDIFNR